MISSFFSIGSRFSYKVCKLKFIWFHVKLSFVMQQTELDASERDMDKSLGSGKEKLIWRRKRWNLWGWKSDIDTSPTQTSLSIDDDLPSDSSGGSKWFEWVPKFRNLGMFFTKSRGEVEINFGNNTQAKSVGQPAIGNFYGKLPFTTTTTVSI